MKVNNDKEEKTSSQDGKTCSACELHKPFSDFYVRKTTGKHEPTCKECTRVRVKKWKSENKERARAYDIQWAKDNKERSLANGRNRTKRWRDNNQDRSRAINRAWRERNKEKERERISLWRAQNPDYGRLWIASNKERMQKMRDEWKRNNPEKITAKNAKRRAMKASAIPKWADKEKISAIYAEARRLSDSHGIAYEVDHIVPLQSRVVCGLHCESNLQIITACDNRRKSNRHEIA